jgi:hypothetical protein
MIQISRLASLARYRRSRLSDSERNDSGEVARNDNYSHPFPFAVLRTVITNLSVRNPVTDASV